MSYCSCECHEYDQSSPQKKDEEYLDNQSQDKLDLEINKLLCQLEEKMENIKDFSELESKLYQLENDIQSLSEEKLKIEYELRQADKGTDHLISDLQIENENLSEQIKEKNIEIEELYLKNNNLYSILDLQIKENQGVGEKLIAQNEVLKEINNDRKNLENNLNNLNILKNQDFSEIQNLEAQINFLTKDNFNNENEINKLDELNKKLFKEIKDEKIKKDELELLFEKNDLEIKENTEELKLAKETLRRLENNFNNLNLENNKNEENKNIYDEDLIKESQMAEDILNKNQQLSDLINEKDKDLDNLNNEAISLKDELNIMNKDIILLDNKIEGYKTHILNLTDINELLSNEIKGILNIDIQMSKNVINRSKYLKRLKEENKNIIDQSLNDITTYMQINGNRGRYIKAKTKKVKNNNKAQKKEKNKNKNYSPMKENENEEEQEENYEEQYSEEQD